MAKPIDFPPPFGAIDAVGAPTDPRDERIEVGVAIVGAGPGGLACAIRLGQLLEEHPDVRERLGDVPIAVLEKGKQAGSHLLSGAVMNPSPLRDAVSRAAQDRRLPHVRRGAGRGRVRADSSFGLPHPAAAHDAQPRESHRLAVRARSFPGRAGGSARRRRAPRDRCNEAPRRARSRGRRAHGRPRARAPRRAAADVRGG